MSTEVPFPATRTEALERLRRFVPRAGRDYAANRNFDLPERGHPHVSGLSPYLRHRLLTEAEVLEAVLARHSPQAAEKFVQEVFWRSYWKGWLEMRPRVWSDYREGVARARAAAARDGDLAAAVARAEAGQTGIAAFDAWAEELAATGYLHNHARMWTASIWIFTLHLPWELGADWFLRHLLDGDPASNTLGWRWVAGLQTPGKHYVARASNIARYTDGRHDPAGQLAEDPAPLTGPAPPARRPIDVPAPAVPGLRTGLLLTEEDLSPRFLLDATPGTIVAHATLDNSADRSPGTVSDKVRSFTAAAIGDARSRWSERLGARGPDATAPDAIVSWARSEGLEQVVTAYAPVGPAARALQALERSLAADGISLVRNLRDIDRLSWPHATHGFFRFRDAIPDLLKERRIWG